MLYLYYLIGRANNIKTLETLKKCGYTGKWYIICDNEDKTIDDYYKNFSRERVIVFDKIKKAKECDTMDNLDARNIVLFARNSCHEIAKSLNLDYFLELDDDYTSFRYRYDDGKKLASASVTNFDKVIEIMLNFLEKSSAITVAFGQTGDMIGGFGSQLYQNRIKRKAMNSFFCKTNRPFKFLGRINEDTNCYSLLGSRGELFITIADITLDQLETQKNSGGLTDSYLDLGTYVKSFYTVICNPSCSKVSVMGDGHYRFHHKVLWENTVPKIISDRFKIKE